MAEAQLAAEGVDVKGVTNVMEEMSRRNREPSRCSVGALRRSRLLDPRGDRLSIDEDYAISRSATPPCPTPLHRPLAAREDGPPRDARSRRRRRRRRRLGHDGRLVAGAAGGGRRGRRRRADRAAAAAPLSGEAVEMSEQFRTATAATADVDAGAGQAEAARELAKLLVAPEGSTLQDILVDESAKLGDATVRSALRAASSTAVDAAAPLGLAPPAALAQLLAPSKDDEAILARRRAPRSRRPSGARGARTRRHRRCSPPQPAAVAESVSSSSPTRSLATTPSRALRASASSRAASGPRCCAVGHPLRRRLELPAAARDAARDANVAPPRPSTCRPPTESRTDFVCECGVVSAEECLSKI